VSDTSMLTESYRPYKIDDIIGQDKAKKTIGSWVRTGRIPRSILIVGAFSAGKTTSARIIGRTVLCFDAKDGNACGECKGCKAFDNEAHPDYIEIDAASDRGIDAMRTLTQRLAMMPLQGKRKVVVLDECFPAETLVMVDYDVALPIKSVVENEAITHVLSYDLESRSIVKKRITGRFARPYEGKMGYVKAGGYTLRATAQHKLFVVGRGYIPLSEIKVGDKLISYDGDFSAKRICQHCNQVFPVDGLPQHVMKAHREQTAHVDYTESRKGVPRSEVVKEKISKSSKEFQKTEQVARLRSRMSEDRGGMKNPVFRYMTPSEVSAFMKENSLGWRATLTQDQKDEITKRFINAPNYANLPNNKEKVVIDFNVTNLKYVGDGSLFMTLTMDDGQTIRKNPDFVYKEDGKVKKIVEVMDLDYWHTHDEANKVVSAYEKLGYPCLVVDAKRIGKDPVAVRGDIEAFVNNHYVEVEECAINAHQNSRDRYVYDIEVEGTHNFFAVPGKPKAGKERRVGSALYAEGIGKPILSSNCHMITGPAFQALLKTLEEPPAHCVIMLVTTNPEKLPATIISRCSKLQLMNVSVEDCTELLLRIAKDKGLTAKGISEKQLKKIAMVTGAHPRNALHALDQVYTMVLDADQAGQSVDTAIINGFIQQVAVSDVDSAALAITRSVLEGKPGGAMKRADDMRAEADILLTKINSFMRQAMLTSISTKLADPYYTEHLADLSIFGIPDSKHTILEAYEVFTRLRIECSNHSVPVAEVLDAAIARAAMVCQKFIKRQQTATPLETKVVKKEVSKPKAEASDDGAELAAPRKKASNVARFPD
jgi:DNA polymerase III gamma/tau subunit